MNEIRIQKINHDDPAVRQRVWDYLTPHETKVMFILGNLRANAPLTHLYVAEQAGQWVGVAAYYERHKSVILFALEPDVIRQLTRHVAGLHPAIDWLNGMEDIARPALEELLRLGYESLRDPAKVFMEADGLPSVQPWEEACRLQRPDDAPAVVRLLRHLQGVDPDAPPTADELARVRTNPDRYVLEYDGRLVSTAATSGIAVIAGQIIGVATEPQYRGRGFAGAACARLMHDLAAKGARRAVLFTDVDNYAAQRCYERLGFRVTGRYLLAKLKAPAGGHPPGATDPGGHATKGPP